ncbi:MAG TPA: hypothetical protein DGF30_02835 [Desulfomicrobium sp.]|nr:hypothetical protein [Desulfomicrobium sp.]
MIRTSHCPVLSDKRPEGMTDREAFRLLQESAAALYNAKLEFLARVQVILDSAVQLTAEPTTGQLTDVQRLWLDAYKVARQGMDTANAGLDSVRTGIDLMGRSLRVEDKEVRL